MRPGGGKGKGSSFERLTCKQLSLWVTGGKKADCFWRSALSGGRATIAHRKGEVVRQAGDITAVSAEGHALTNFWYIECKHYKNLDIDSFCLTGKGSLAKFWKVACREAAKHHREPMLIARQNRIKDLIVLRPHALKSLTAEKPASMLLRVKNPKVGVCEVRYLNDVLACPFKGE